MILALVGSILFGGCESDLDKVKRLTDKFCHCKDEECTSKVIESMSNDVPDDVFRRLMRDEPKEVQAQIKRAVKCWTEFETKTGVSAEMPFSPSQEIPEFPRAR